MTGDVKLLISIDDASDQETFFWKYNFFVCRHHNVFVNKEKAEGVSQIAR